MGGPMNEQLCKHNDLLVQRNNGRRWVTCGGCLTDFIPEAEVLAYVVTLPGAEVRQWHEPIEIHPRGRPDLGNEIPPGRYLVVPWHKKEESDV